jgi:hypothetical protein
MKTIVKERNKAYYFSHETIEKLEAGKIRFVDSAGVELKPNYFGAGLSGMNGILKAVQPND